MATLHLLSGPPGAGKSTWGRACAAQVASPDALREERFGGRHDVWGDPEQFVAWRRWSFEGSISQAKTALQAGQDVVFDITACLRQERESVLTLLSHLAEHKAAHVFRTPLEICLNRNSDRGDQQVPETVVVEKYQSLWSSPSTADEGFDQIVCAPIVLCWRAKFGRAEVVIGPDRMNIGLYPAAWTRPEAEQKALRFKDELERVFGTQEGGFSNPLLSRAQGTGEALAIQCLGPSHQELRPLEEEWTQLKTLFPPE